MKLNLLFLSVPRVWDNLVHIHSIHGQCQVRAEFDSRSWGCGHGITRLICYSLVFTLDNCGSGADKKQGASAIAIYTTITRYQHQPSADDHHWPLCGAGCALCGQFHCRCWCGCCCGCNGFSLSVSKCGECLYLFFFLLLLSFEFFPVSFLIAKLNFSDLMRMHTRLVKQTTAIQTPRASKVGGVLASRFNGQLNQQTIN